MLRICLCDRSVFSVSSIRNSIRLFLAAATATATATAERRVGRRTAAVIVVSTTVRVGVVVRPVATRLLESTAIENPYARCVNLARLAMAQYRPSPYGTVASWTGLALADSSLARLVPDHPSR